MESTHIATVGRRWPAASTPPLAIDATGLHKSFGAVHAVDDVTLRVAPGEVVAFLGPNGAGKTTTIDLLRRPQSGEVLGRAAAAAAVRDGAAQRPGSADSG